METPVNINNRRPRTCGNRDGKQRRETRSIPSYDVVCWSLHTRTHLTFTVDRPAARPSASDETKTSNVFASAPDASTVKHVPAECSRPKGSVEPRTSSATRRRPRSTRSAQKRLTFDDHCVTSMSADVEKRRVQNGHRSRGGLYLKKQCVARIVRDVFGRVRAREIYVRRQTT